MRATSHGVEHPGPDAAKRGRPRKFGRPARPVTLTLPLDVIAMLERTDSDLSRAIVQLAAKAAPEPDQAAAHEAELFRYGRRVIVVNPSRALRAIRGVELVPLPNGRALISLERSMTPEAFELRLRDALDVDLPGPDHAGIRDVIQVLSDARRAGDARLQTRTILVLESTRTRPGQRRSE